MYVFVGSQFGFGAVIQLRPIADTSLKELFPTNNLGGLSFLLAGGSEATPRRHRALLKFDLSAIPAGARIDSAFLLLEVTLEPANAMPPPSSLFSLHRMLVPWGEGNNLTRSNCLSCAGEGLAADLGEATWNNAFHQQAPWSAPGAEGNYATNVSASEFVYGTADSPYRFGPSDRMLADLRMWHANSAINFGWMFLSAEENTAFTARRFGSRESTHAPILEVSFTAAPILQAGLVSAELEIAFPTEAGVTYLLQFRGQIGQQWSPSSEIIGDGNLVRLSVPIDESAGFYRVVID